MLKSKYNLSQKEISKRVGKSRSLIANSLRLLKLPTSLKDDIKQKKITMGHAISLLALKNKTQMLAIGNRIINEKLSVRDTDKIVAKINGTSSSLTKKGKSSKPNFLSDMESKLIHKYGTKVKILFNKDKKGKIVFEYYTKQDLERILNLLNSKK